MEIGDFFLVMELKSWYNEKKEKSRELMKKRGKVFFKFLMVLFVIIGIGIFFVGYELSKIQKEPLDESDLEVNFQLYQEVSDLVSKEEFQKIHTIVLFGSDSRNQIDATQGRTDCIMIASINPKKKSIKLVSIPRDSYVEVPGYGYTKLNHAYAYGGEQLMIKTINRNFGMNITEYMTINFAGFIHIVNAIGGVELEITKAEMDAINEYLKESYDVSDHPYTPITEYGKVRLNGEEALSHARDRNVGNDFARATRQREVLSAIMEQSFHIGPIKVLSLFANEFLEEITTNIDFTKYIGILGDILLHKNDYLQNIVSVQVPSTRYGYDKYIRGTYYYCFDDNQAKEDLYHHLYGE